ncbi:MAG: anhydro-N-acetylmuramic acid kinase [Gammaproteobacteria bacterium]|nr:MAG: anhydro-N-acetylmuramic acid kinase [Gammaproteobacteria bacterium]
MKIIGMMSGTSLDGVDAVLAEYDVKTFGWRLCAHAVAPLPAALKETLFQLNFPSRLANELHVAKVAEHQLTHCYASAYQTLVSQLPATDCQALAGIAAHGQTIRHAPNITTPYTLQLLNGALLSQLTRQTVVCDFRSRDIASGGQGAPLAPLFHRELFKAQPPFAVVNIGGISNISVLDPTVASGFDCGPGNGLLDEWIGQHHGKAYDHNAHWARQGRVLEPLLARLLSDAYFRAPAPKSTGRDYFHLAWLAGHLTGDERPEDVMRTLVALSAKAIADCVPSAVQTLIVVGGGAKNPLLMADLATCLPNRAVKSSEVYGIDAQHVEALGFAMLGRSALLGEAVDTTRITGAKKPVVLGAIYPSS